MTEQKTLQSPALAASESPFVMVKMESLTLLLNEVKSLRAEIATIKAAPTKRLYTNKEVMELLGIKDKLLKKYRDDGLLAYRQVGDKFWYTQADVDQFLASHYYAAYREAC